MALTYLGEQALSSIVPGLNSAIASLQADSTQLHSMLTDKNSDINGITAQINGMNAAVSQAQTLLTAAQNIFNAATNAVNSSDTLTANLAAALASANIHEYVWNGQISQLSSDIAASIGSGGLPGGTGGTQLGNAILIITTDGNAWQSIKTVLRFQ